MASPIKHTISKTFVLARCTVLYKVALFSTRAHTKLPFELPVATYSSPRLYGLLTLQLGRVYTI
ncbi:hypothetical protein Mapa_012967 [Marchantia paleacea]|nr:hypothetical protein Mapa_012967 [Marchantia paleacea]